MVDSTYTCIKNIASSSFAFLRGLEHLSELREFSNFEGDFDEATGKEVNCSWAVEAVAE